jgi:glycosyltransferase involved in cell wall biosynthesis
MSKVLFIRSNPVDPDPRVEKEASTLGKNGYEVEVLAWDRSCSSKIFEDKTFYKIRRAQIKAPYGDWILIFRLIIWSCYELFYLSKTDYDVIHACDLDTMLPAVIASKIRSKSLVYDCFDFYADSLPEKVPSFLRDLIANIEIFFSKFADFVILADESRNDQFKNKLKKVVIINNTPKEVKLTKKINKNERKEFTIFYAGVIKKTRGFDKILAATKNMSCIKLLIAGYDTDKEKISEKLKKIENVTFIGKLAYEEVIKETVKSDVLFALYDPIIPNHRYASPNKVFEAMMCGKPIIVNSEMGASKIVQNEDCGIIVNYDDVKSIKNALIALEKNPNLREKLGKNGKKAYETKYSWELMEKQLLNAYDY